MLVPWWSWLVAGFVLMLAELLASSGFFLFFFGVGAILTAVLSLAFAGTALDTFVLQGVAFLVISLLCIVLLRKPLWTRFHFRNQHLPVNSLIGQSARALESIPPGQIGKVELHGTSWSARNTGLHGIQPDAPCRVHHIEGLTLLIQLQET